MLHFVTSYMKQNKSRKQTLESAQSRLEISFKLINFKMQVPWASNVLMMKLLCQGPSSVLTTGSTKYVIAAYETTQSFFYQVNKCDIQVQQGEM